MPAETKERKQALAALKTAKGQIDGILNMLEENRYCIDISNQILAAQSQVARANKLILIQHLHTCIIDAADNEEDLKQKTEELITIFDKLLK